MSNRLQRALSKAQQKSPQNSLGKGLITYLMAGDPDQEITLRRLLGLAQAGVDVLELGVPFSDPIADGSVIQEAGLRALAGGMNLKRTLELVSRFRTQNRETPVILMSYLNPLLNYGYDRFFADGVASGVDGVILPDLPWRESMTLRQRAQSLVGDQLTFIPMIAQTSHPDHIQSLALLTEGFAYVLSRNGITGGEAEIPPHILDFILSLKSSLLLPRFVGFGIQTSEQVNRLSGACEGVIVGSALVRRFAELDALNLPEPERTQGEQVIYDWILGLRNSTT